MLHPSDRAELKARAKETLHGAAPGIYLVSLVFLAMNAAANTVLELHTVEKMVNTDSLEQMVEIYQNSNLLQNGALLMVATLLLNIFLTLVGCGYRLYSLRAVRGEETGGVETLFACFHQLGRFVAAFLLIELFVMLWTMLFIIPGLIAIFAYSQTFYILLDDPDIPPLEAIRASKQMMRGHKAEFFVLELSFFGWAFLAMFTFGLLNIWVSPYQQLTFANYYNALTGWSPAAPEEPAEPEFTVEDWWKQ